MRVCEIGIDGEGLLVAGQGLIRTPQVLERNAKVVVSVGVIGPDGEGPLVAGDGLIGPPQFFERGTQVTVRLGVIGIDGDGFRYEIDGNVVLPALMGEPIGFGEITLRIGSIPRSPKEE